MSPAAVTDRSLLTQYVTCRDQETFRALVQRHGPDVLRICRWVLRDEHDAEDAFQATFLLLVRKATDIHDPDQLAKWLRGTAYKVASRTRRNSLRRAERERKRAEMLPNDSVTDSIEHDLPQLLRDELDRLPSHYRAPLVLCYLEGFTHEETARQLEWPAGTVKTRLVRARHLLRERLERRGVALGAGLLFLIRRDASANVVSPRLVESTARAMARAVDVAGTVSSATSQSATSQSVMESSPERIRTRSGRGHPAKIASRFPWIYCLITAAFFSLGLLAWISFSASAARAQFSEIPEAWTAPNLTNVLAVDCKD